jgi:hypothetical protein
MSIVCSKIGAVVMVLYILAEDLTTAHKDDKIWASEVIAAMSGPDGFRNLIQFGVDSDYAVTTHILVRCQDRSEADVALTASEVVGNLEMQEALFWEGRIFDSSANDTYTNRLLVSLRDMWARAFGGQPVHERLRQLNWPDDFMAALAPIRVYAQELYLTSKEFFHLNFPDHSWRCKFAAFAQGRARLPEPLQLQYIGELAAKEGVDAAQAQHQFLRLSPSFKRMHAESGDNRRMCERVVESLRTRTGYFRKDFADIIEIMLTYIGILDGTSDVERLFAKVELLEMKRRIHHFDCVTMKDALQVLLEIPMQLGALVSVSHHAIPSSVVLNNARELQVLWRPGKIILKAQRKYATFFGKRKLVSRSLAPQSTQQRAISLASVKVRVQPTAVVRKTVLKVTRRRRKEEWLDSVKSLVSDMRKAPKVAVVPDSSAFLSSQRLLVRARLAKDHVHFLREEASNGLSSAPKPFNMPRERQTLVAVKQKLKKCLLNKKVQLCRSTKPSLFVFVTQKAMKKHPNTFKALQRRVLTNQVSILSDAKAFIEKARSMPDATRWYGVNAQYKLAMQKFSGAGHDLNAKCFATMSTCGAFLQSK